MDIPIYLFSNSNYKEICLNWILHAQEIGLGDYHIVCHDRETENFVRRYSENKALGDEQFHFKITKRNRADYWQFRKQLFAKLVNRQNGCVFSDLDAIWKHDLRKEILDICRKHDLVFSKVEHSLAWPQEIYCKTGFTVCMGWWFAKPTEAVASFLEDLCQNEEKDDQKAANKLLLSKIDDFETTGDLISLKTRNLKIAVLPSCMINRPLSLEENLDAAVVHPVILDASPRDTLRSYNLWKKRKGFRLPLIS